MPALGEQMRLDRHAGLLAGIDQHQRVLDRYAIVGDGMPYEYGRRLRVDMPFDGHRVQRHLIIAVVAKQTVEAATMRERAEVITG